MKSTLSLDLYVSLIGNLLFSVSLSLCPVLLFLYSLFSLDYLALFIISINSVCSLAFIVFAFQVATGALSAKSWNEKCRSDPLSLYIESLDYLTDPPIIES